MPVQRHSFVYTPDKIRTFKHKIANPVWFLLI